MINIRRIEMEDALGFVTLNQELAKETKYMMRELEECMDHILPARELIASFHEQDNFLYIAETGGKLIGFAMAVKENFNRVKHRAYLVIGIQKAFQGQGIGSRLFEEIDQWAVNQGLKRLELTTMTHNVAGKALYEKYGFVVEGIKKKSMYIDGEYVDEYYMGKILED